MFGCQAPDAGNAEILHLFGTPEQKERWLAPLVAGEIRSFFAMTEPEVSGADPTGLQGRAVRDGDEWVIDAHKWFSSGADGAAFGIVDGSSPTRTPSRTGAMSQIIVPADAPGYRDRARDPGDGPRGTRLDRRTARCATRACASRSRTLLGERGRRLPDRAEAARAGRIHHVMRWLGQMQRAFELMCARALEREAFGGPLADKQTVQNWIADSAAEIQACRLLTLDAARKIDAGDEARVEISLVKFYAARVLHDVIDRAVQVHGALGLTDDLPLAGDVPRSPAPAGSTTAPTRCTGWSSAAGS